jgi:hypothetical protein
VQRAALYRKTVRVKLPDGFSFDDPPVPVNYDSEFAKFSLTFKQEPGILTMTEELRMDAKFFPANQLEAIKKFFDQCHGADRQDVVLVKN